MSTDLTDAQWRLLDYAQSTNALLGGTGFDKLAPLASANAGTAALELDRARGKLAALDGLSADADPHERADIERQIRQHLALADRRARDAAEQIQQHLGAGTSFTGALALARWLVELHDKARD